MNVAITGASGFIGRRATEFLTKQGHNVQPVSLRTNPSPEQFAGCEAVVHLAGEPVAQRWTAGARLRILESRVEGTRALVAALRAHPPNVLVSASGVGYYGSCGDKILTEQSQPAADFLGQVASGWEREAHEAERLGTRVICLRIGTVLGPGGGALKKMLLPFKLGLGGRLGPGTQWMSWIHLDDLCALIHFCLPDSTRRGVFNAVSPYPVTNASFTRALGHALHRPAFLPVPALALRLMFGDMAEMLLGSQRAVPEAAMACGFEFAYPEITAALIQILDS